MPFLAQHHAYECVGPNSRTDVIPVRRFRASINSSNGFKDFHTENGSCQGYNLALTGLFVPRSLDSDSGLQSVLSP